jgi:hypothetical protein
LLYAPQATPEFNARLHDALRELAADVRRALGDDLVALILGGGYGRGEGAVVRRHGVEQPYNDLDLTIVVRHPRALDEARGELRGIEHRYADRLGIDIDFSRPLTVRDIERWPCCLMWQDLLSEHVTLAGPAGLLNAHAPPTLAAPLPPIEGTRLLLNRGAGLVWALRVARGMEAGPDPDFVRRNMYKCQLALGDALLIAHGRFVSRYQGRDLRLRALREEVPSAPDVLALYEPALRFKFCPDDLPSEIPPEARLLELAGHWREVWLHVERIRSGAAYPSIDDYLADASIREPAQNAPRQWARNLAQNLRAGRLSLRYPRERLYRWLAGLLPPSGAEWAAESEQFLELWKRFN